MFKKVDQRQAFPKLEEAILDKWDQEKTFEASLAKNQGKKKFVFFEGPPTANGKPGIHHVLARVFKDIIPRFKTMQGYEVKRKAGWDTHGLPVELEVEKKLKISGKPEIEKYGIAKFNRQCKESVWQYTGDWAKLTRRIAYWVDLQNPYITYKSEYIESLWWIFKQLWNSKLLYLGHKVVPHCPRCGTALSSHEVAQGYKKVTEDSIYIKFKVAEGKGEVKPGDYIMSWTTTPWTLPGNVALAIDKTTDYSLVEQGGERLVLATALLDKALEGKYKVLGNFSGEEIEGIKYEPLFPGAVEAGKHRAFEVVLADFVTTEDGTGVVHTAVMYGEDDYQLGEQMDLPHQHTVDENGKFMASVPKWQGRFVKSIEPEIIKDLQERNLLYRVMPYAHDYPFCWRCDSPLLYYAKNSWFIKMSELRDRLLANNEQINWVPDYIKHGRFGEWLREIKDWAVSRERYWGTPLPIWQCSDCGCQEVIGSVEELIKKSVDPDKTKSILKTAAEEMAVGEKEVSASVQEEVDLHRPYVDDIELACQCGKAMKRVKDVADCWFDSGSMPFAQSHYPFARQELIDKNEQFPADYISEAIDQTRGWFYTLLAASTALGKGNSYQNVICLGHILDEKGHKMSKSKGNVIDPWQVADTIGIDALRFYLYTINQPGMPKRFADKGLKEVSRNIVMKIWNTYSFFSMYANVDKWSPGVDPKNSKNVLDKWILSRLNLLIKNVTLGLEAYDVYKSAKEIEAFVDDLSNWYVRRSRRRFWKSENDDDKINAYATLHRVLIVLSQIAAPFMPFITEEIYGNLSGEQSVHLSDWPKCDDELVDEKLNEEMARTREVVALGLAARAESGVKVRQPLARLQAQKVSLRDELKESIKDELNVKDFSEAEKIDYTKSETNGKTIYQAKSEGVTVAGDKDLVVALDTKLTPELVQEGMAREIVRNIQWLRKQADYKIDDRIKTYFSFVKADNNLRQAFDNNLEYIMRETLSTELEETKNEVDASKEIGLGEGRLWIGVKK